MKNLTCILLCLMILFSMAACEEGVTEPEGSLLYDLQINRDEIDYISITDNQMTEIKITDKQAISYLYGYTYTGEFPGDRLHELFLKPTARDLRIYYGKSMANLILLEDGSIVVQKMDNESVSAVAYYLYNADSASEAMDTEVLEDLI